MSSYGALGSWIALSLLAATATACGDDTDAGGGGGGGGGALGGGGAGGSAPLAPDFGECPEHYVAECATLELPLDHDAPDGESIEVHIARQPATAPANRQIWLLSGGPGQAGYIFERTIPRLAEAVPDADIYVIDHRGTGYSHRLACAAQDKPNSNGGYYLNPADAEACLSELSTKGDVDRLPYFTTAQAARDLLEAIRRTRLPEQEVYVWGGSYGTHWAHRTLQLATDELTGVVFDGFMAPDRYSFLQYDGGIEEVGVAFSELCTEDEACSARMGTDPAARARALWVELERTPCAGVDGELARQIASMFLEGSARSWVFPLLHRLERCSADDVAAISTLFGRYQDAVSGGAPAPMLNSGVLQYNIVLSELWRTSKEREMSAEELQETAAAQTFLVGSSYPASIVHLKDVWPLPPNDYDRLALPVSSDVSMLWVAGDMDSRTPVRQSRQITELYPAESFVLLPGGWHVPTQGSPLASDPQRHCGFDIATSFFRGQRDTSCIDELRPVLLSAPNAEAASTWWGTDDDWGDGAPQPRPSAAATLRVAVDELPTESARRAARLLTIARERISQSQGRELDSQDRR